MDDFAEYLKFGAGKPHLIESWEKYTYGVHITGNVRLIILVEADSIDRLEEVKHCIVKGVVDYHGRSSDTWYLP